MSDASASPLERCLSREVARGRSVLCTVLADLTVVQRFCSGADKATNHARDLISCFLKESVPVGWRAEYVSVKGLPLGPWVVDLAARLRALDRYRPLLTRVAVTGGARGGGAVGSGIGSGAGGAADGKNSLFWVGGMFVPESFVTATRQHAAQTNGWSLEELELFLDIGINAVEGTMDTVIEGVVLESAHWSAGTGVVLSTDLRCPLPPSRLRWYTSAARKEKYPETITLPVYLNDSRSSLVVEVFLPAPKTLSKLALAQRGVALVMQVTEH